MLLYYKSYALRQKKTIIIYRVVYCNAEIAYPASFMTLKDSQERNPQSLTLQKVTSSWPVHQRSKGSGSADVCCLEINKLHAVCVCHLGSTVLLSLDFQTISLHRNRNREVHILTNIPRGDLNQKVLTR